MSDTVEIIAKAMAVADGKDPDAPAWVRYPGGVPFGVCWADQYADKAETALSALRDAGMVVVKAEPDEAMTNAGLQTGVLDCKCANGSPVVANAVYCAMIAAAEEGK